MFTKQEYLEELRTQIQFVDTVEEFEELMITIRELEESIEESFLR